MADAEIPNSLRAEARAIYGSDVASYRAGRPDYPPAVYEALGRRCGLGSGTRVLEVGPGTGLVTAHLLNEAAEVVVIEPDPEMAAYLSDRFAAVRVINDTFEHADLGERQFDLVVAATSFHWVDQSVGIPTISRVLKPGGWVALWWTIFDDRDRPDPFRDQLQALTGEDDPGGQSRVDFQMDIDGRQRDLRVLGGLERVDAQTVRWTIDMDREQLEALYASFINVARRREDEKRRLLQRVAAAAEALGPTITRSFLTVLYTGQKPL